MTHMVGFRLKRGDFPRKINQTCERGSGLVQTNINLIDTSIRARSLGTTNKPDTNMVMRKCLFVGVTFNRAASSN